MAAYSNSSSHADTCPEYSEDFPLIEKPATKSIVWNYFGLQADESGKVLTERERERERGQTCMSFMQEGYPSKGW